jgi:polar amino acid transport system permease protein
VRRTTRRLIIRFAAYGLVLGLFALVASRVDLHYGWRWDDFFDRWVHLLVDGLFMTLKVSFGAMLLALPMGILIGLCRTSHDPGARLLGFGYVELFRGTPLLVQVMIWYYCFAGALGLEQLGAAIVALGCFAGSYIAEIVRAGIQSIDRGQMEAARSLGLSHVQALRYVILPQALRRIMPPLASEFIALVKDSSLASMIGLLELTQQTRGVQSSAYMTFEPWLMAAVLYLSINVVLSLAVRGLERKLGVSQRGEGIR